jgi:hypothetical protein
MRTWTNLTWPDDPYRTGQQLYRRPAPRLAAFTTWPALAGDQLVPVTTAVVYLTLHRSRPVTVTGQTLTFGFRAASTSDPAQAADVAGVADLDLMQARRHAAVLTGYELARDLATLQQASTGAARRGTGAVAAEWGRRGPATGRADLFDASLDLPGNPSLAQACQQAKVNPVRAGTSDQEDRHPVTLAVERALAVALVCARHLGRCEWDAALDTRAVMAACAWDCLPRPDAGAPATGAAMAPAGGQRG